MSRRLMTARCAAGSASIAASIRSRVSSVSSRRSGSASQEAGGAAQCPGHVESSLLRKRSGGTAGSGTRPGFCRAESGIVLPSRPARVFAVLARIRKIQVLSDERPSKRSRPFSTATHVSWTTSSVTARLMSSADATLAEVAAAHGPFDLILEATGYSPLVFEAAEVLGRNGVLVLASVTGGDRRVEAAADRINQSFVLGNKVMVGTVNAAREDFERGVDDLLKAEALYPGWLAKLLTTPIAGLERYEEMVRALTEDRDAIKVYVEVGV
jgi:glucose dehydrogenase-like enzyme